MAATINLAAVLSSAREMVEVNGEKLTFSDVSLWWDKMPSSRPPKGAHISVTVKRAPASSIVAPKVVRLHVVRTNGTGPDAADARNPDTYFAWNAPASAGNETDAYAQKTLLTRPDGWMGPGQIVLAAWDGPKWDNNGEIGYEAIAEFAGAVFLRSGEKIGQVVC